MKFFYLALAIGPLLLSPIFRLIDSQIWFNAMCGNVGFGGIGMGLVRLYSIIFIIVMCGLGALLYSRMESGVVMLNPLKLIIQFDGVAKNIIRILGYIQIFFSYQLIINSLPVWYRIWRGPFQLLSGIFGIIGAMLFILVFCSVESVEN